MQADFVRPDPDERVLSFVPADPDRAHTLTSEQVAHYNRAGFVGGLALFNPVEAAELRGYIAGLVDHVVNAPDARDSYSINAYHLTCQGLYDLVQRPLLLDYVVDLIGPDVVCW